MTIPAWIRVAFWYATRSLLEFGFLALFGLMPVWLGAIFSAVGGSPWVPYLNGYLNDGEALLLSAAVIGPLMYLVVASDFGAKQNRRHFPMKGWYVLAISAVCVISAGLVGYEAASAGHGGTVSEGVMWWISLFVSLASIVVWFAITGTIAARENGAARIMREEERSFVSDFEGP